MLHQILCPLWAFLFTVWGQRNHMEAHSNKNPAHIFLSLLSEVLSHYFDKPSLPFLQWRFTYRCMWTSVRSDCAAGVISMCINNKTWLVYCSAPMHDRVCYSMHSSEWVVSRWSVMLVSLLLWFNVWQFRPVWSWWTTRWCLPHWMLLITSPRCSSALYAWILSIYLRCLIYLIAWHKISIPCKCIFNQRKS